MSSEDECPTSPSKRKTLDRRSEIPFKRSSEAALHSGGGTTNIENSTIYVGAENTEGPSTPRATGARPKQRVKEGFVQITDDIFVNTEKPLKEGTRIYEGYQQHAGGQTVPLAMKLIIPCNDKSIREVDHLVKLTPHPNIVRIIGSKVRKGTFRELFIAMELCSSQNLQDYCKENCDKNAPFDFKKTMKYSKRLVKAMKHIHRNRIIHGDLKPENILFSLDGDEIKVSDFGISKQLKQTRSITNRTSQGTDGYRAPETYNSDIISKKADIFSLGATLYFLWTNGNHPFGEDHYQRVVNIRRNAGRTLSGLPEEMGDKEIELLNLLDRMLDFDPEKRPTIEEIAEHLFFKKTLGATAPVEDPTSHPSSSHQPGTDAGPNESLKSETLRKMKNLGMNLDLNVWKIIVMSDKGSKQYCDKVILNMDEGCRIYGRQLVRENELPPWKVRINGKERSISELNNIRLTINHHLLSAALHVLGPSSVSQIWPGIVTWFDHETLQLFAVNFTSLQAEFRKTSDLDPDCHFSPLPEKESVMILFMKEFVDLIERKNRTGEHTTTAEGVEIRMQVSPHNFLKVQIIPSEILTVSSTVQVHMMNVYINENISGPFC